MDEQIRVYGPTYKDACIEAFRSNVPDFFTNDEVGDFERFLDRVDTAQADERTYFYVVIVDDKVVGCGGFGDKDNTGEISLAWGLIHRDYHKMNYGRSLLKYRLSEIDRIYPKQPVFIDTTQFSYGFFEKYGFEVLKITPDHYAVGMHRYDMVRRNVSLGI